ncbi:MAG: hypothetical protein AB4290_08010 [Spirulina sp.]
MSKSDLMAYVIKNRHDLEAIRVLFTPPLGVEIKRYPPMFTDDGKPIEENIRIAEEAMRNKFEEMDRQKQQKSKEDKYSDR